MGQSARQIFIEHKGKVSDKWELYLDEWDRLFMSYRDQEIRLLEIGVQNGGSLEIWAKFFLNANKIIGCDIDKKCEELIYDDARIIVIAGDINSDECTNKVLLHAPKLDIILDDGSHNSSDIVRSFGRYFPHLNDNGIYVVEDMHCSYWQNFEGGLNNPLSAISFFKRLSDIINYEHWRNNTSRVKLLSKFSAEFDIEFDEHALAEIHSVEFVNSLCIVRKLPAHKNVLGNRMIVGSEDSVASGWNKYDGTSIQDIPADIKDDANLDIFEVITRVKSLSKTISILEQALQEKATELSEIHSSTAWKIVLLLWKIRLWLMPKGSTREKLGRDTIGIFRKKEAIILREDKSEPDVSSPQGSLVDVDSLDNSLNLQAHQHDNENQPLVSVIIPCYNDGIFLHECLSSVYNQTYKLIEIVIINDGSTDDLTNNLLENSSWPFTKIINIKHSGPSAARNSGIKVANGKYILPLDADDKIHPNYIEKAVALLEEMETTGIVYCQAEYFGNLIGRWELTPYSIEVMLLDNVIFTTALFRKNDWQIVDGYDESLQHGMEDYDFWLSLIELGKEVVQIPEVLFYYRIRDKSRTNKFNEKMEQVQDTYLKIYRNHPRLLSKYQDEYSIGLRNALIELVFLKRKLEES